MTMTTTQLELELENPSHVYSLLRIYKL